MQTIYEKRNRVVGAPRNWLKRGKCFKNKINCNDRTYIFPLICLGVCVCVRACVRACVCARVCVCACVCVTRNTQTRLNSFRAAAMLLVRFSILFQTILDSRLRG